MSFGRDVAISMRNFVKRFGDIVAVRGLNLDIYDREIFGLLGPNGSGKSTTMLTIATVYRPTEGDIYVYGKSVSRESDEVRKYVGIAFQEPKAMWIDKPIEILTWHARVIGYSMSDARRVVREVMEMLDLWEHRNKMFSELSGGTRKKVEVAKVLIQRPRVAIFDEPTAQLDVIAKHIVRKAIKELSREGSTVIVATNEMYEAEALSERIGIIYKGELKGLGTPAELKDKIPGGDIIEIHIEGSLDPLTKQMLAEKLGAYKIDHNNGLIRIYVDKGEEKITPAIEMLSNKVKIKMISMKEPSLDDVFMFFTGARLGE
ncbi:MAG: ABC transporter ATP-binding protein [Desulfurococcales archaeon]|nr:ABC transporter ATP-binding protein [Desulfurococcales archaeon]